MNYNNSSDQYFDSLLDKYRDLAKADQYVVELTDLLYEHVDESPKDMSEEDVQEFKNIIYRIVPGRATDIFFDMLNNMMTDQQYDQQEFIKKFAPIELNLVVNVLMYVMVIMYEKDIPLEYKQQIKSNITVCSMFTTTDANSCCIL